MKGCLPALGATALLIFAVPFGCALMDAYGRSDNAPPSAATPSIDATPQEVLSAFQANEVAAKARYGSAPVRLTGRVTKVSDNLTGQSIIDMDAGGGNVQAHMLDSSKAWVARLSIGDGIAVLCDSPDYILGIPTLSHCVPTDPPAGAFAPASGPHHHHRRHHTEA